MKTGEELLDSINLNYGALTREEKLLADIAEDHEKRLLELESKRGTALRSAAPDLLAACKWFVKQLEDGVIVRDITKDAQGDWASRMLHFTMELQKATSAISKAEAL